MNQLKVGAFLSYVSIFLTFAVGIIYTPILIRMLGQSNYGLYSIVLSLASYLSLLDMGLGNAIIRYVARNKEIGDSKSESDLIGQFLKFFCIISLLTLIVGLLIYWKTPTLFQRSLTLEEIEVTKKMIIILTFNFALSFPLNVYSAAVQAHERFIFLRVTSIIRIVSVPILTLIVLSFGGELVAMTIVTTIVNLSILFVVFMYSKIKLKIKTTFTPLSKDLKKDIYIYSFFIFISAIADKFYWQTDQILLGIFTNSKVVAVYAIAIQLVLIFATLSTAISNLFLPRLSKIVLQDDNVRVLNNIFNDISKYQFIIVSLTFSGFVLFGQEFISIWAGENYKAAYFIVIIIMIAFFGDLIQNMGLMIMQAKGLYYFRAITLLICSIANLVISIPIIKMYGAYGTAIITALCIFLGNVVILNFYFHIKLKLDMFVYWKKIFLYSVPLALLFIVSIGIKYLIAETSNPFILFLEISIYTIVYLLVVWNFIFLRGKAFIK